MIYPFLTAILPVLDPASPPELTVAEFDDLAREELPASRFEKMISWDEQMDSYPVPVYNEMRKFQDYLRYRIALLRAEKLKSTQQFDEPDEFCGEVDFALAGMIAADTLEKERTVDAVCWRKLDDLEVCHEMDFEHLCIYRIRLGMLQKYTARDKETGRKNFEAALEKLAAAFNEP
jgi:hypothetical protein